MRTSDRTGLSRRGLLADAAALPSVPALLVATAAEATAAGVLPSWKAGPARQAALDFVRVTTDQSSKNFVAPEDRIATFDQDGTLWVEHPLYTQAILRSTAYMRWRRSTRNGEHRSLSAEVGR